MGRDVALPEVLFADKVEVHPQLDELPPGVGRERVRAKAKARAEVRRRMRESATRKRTGETAIVGFIFACGL